jgi:hypothetical protein
MAVRRSETKSNQVEVESIDGALKKMKDEWGVIIGKTQAACSTKILELSAQNSYARFNGTEIDETQASDIVAKVFEKVKDDAYIVQFGRLDFYTRGVEKEKDRQNDPDRLPFDHAENYSRYADDVVLGLVFDLQKAIGLKEKEYIPHDILANAKEAEDMDDKRRLIRNTVRSIYGFAHGFKFQFETYDRLDKQVKDEPFRKMEEKRVFVQYTDGAPVSIKIRS